MDEALFARLAEVLNQGQAVVVASVLTTHGSTPRKRQARMLIQTDAIHFSVGGGAMEARVIAQARQMLATGGEQQTLTVSLDGSADAAGICGGGMSLALRRWHGPVMSQRAQTIATALAAGERQTLSPEDLGAPEATAQPLRPRPRLLILGAGHCGHALAELARYLAFEVVVADSRPECFVPGRFEGVQCIDAEPASLRAATRTGRDLYIVLVNRDFPADVAALEALAGTRCAFLGMMGSRRRVQLVRQALPQHTTWLQQLVAPVGIEIGEQTPHEIAVSILAQVLECRSRQN